MNVVSESASHPRSRIALWNFEMRPKLFVLVARSVEEAKLYATPFELPLLGPDKDGKIIICGDGTQYIFEIVDANARQRLFSRHSCELKRDPKFASLAQRMLIAGKLTIPYEVQDAVIRGEVVIPE